jgi:hypothetical protein
MIKNLPTSWGLPPQIRFKTHLFGIYIKCFHNFITIIYPINILYTI